jgi:hypothetical protein
MRDVYEQMQEIEQEKMRRDNGPMTFAQGTEIIRLLRGLVMLPAIMGLTEQASEGEIPDALLDAALAKFSAIDGELNS